MTSLPGPPTAGREAWAFYLSLYRPHRTAVVAAVALAVAQALVVLPIGAVVGRAFDVLVPAGDTRGLAVACAAVAALYLANGALALLSRRLVLTFTKEVVTRLRDDLAGRLLAMPRSFHDDADRAGLHTVAVTDTERVDVMSNALVAQVLPASLASALLAAVLMGLSPRLFAILAAVVPPLYLLRRALRTRQQLQVQSFHRAFERFSAGVAQALRTMDLVRSRAAEESEHLRRREESDNLRTTSRSMAFAWSAFAFAQSTIAATAGAVVLAFGGAAVAQGSLTIGALLSFFVVMGLFNAQLRTVVAAAPSIVEGSEALRRIVALLRREDVPPYRGERRLSFTGALTLRDVTFGFPRQDVLSGVSLEIAPGEVVAVTGPNGAGKSTLVNLVLGCYRPTAGTLAADGVPYDELDLRHLRRQLGVLHQDPFLIDATVAENIAFGRPAADSTAIARAAALADLDGLISRLPGGLATPVGDLGQLLSAGERQKVALARALVTPSALLLLDEPTSNLDLASRARVLAGLAKLEPRPAMLLITHDQEVLAFASRVLVLRDGRLLEHGGTRDEGAA